MISKFNYQALILSLLVFLLAATAGIPVSAQQKGKTAESNTSVTIDKEEAKKAFEYLNKVRSAPAKYSQETGVNLNAVKPRPALIWNDTLAKVAEERAMDLAKRNYFSHVNPEGEGVNILIYRAGYKLPAEWIKNKKANNFESLQAGAETGVEAIKDLILDKGIPNFGHRKHLLGIEEWNESLKDIGIGFVSAPDTPYQTYICIIIAKHNW